MRFMRNIFLNILKDVNCILLVNLAWTLSHLKYKLSQEVLFFTDYFHKKFCSNKFNLLN